MLEKSILINEQQYLTSLLNHRDLIKEEKENYLINTVSKVLFNALKKLYNEGATFDPHTISSECYKRNNEVTPSLVGDLKSKVSYSKEDFPYYKKRLVEDYVKEKVGSSILRNATNGFLSKGELDLSLVDRTIKDLEWAKNTINPSQEEYKNLKTLFEEHLDTLENRGDSSNFMSTGMTYLDNHLLGGGIPKGQFITLFSGPGMGKSTVVLNMVNGSINKMTPLLYYPLEMGQELTMDKLLSFRTQIPLSEFYKTDTLTGSAEEYLIEAVKMERNKIARSKYFRMVDGTRSVKKIQEDVKQMKRDLEVPSVQIVIDLFTQLEEARGDNKASTYQDLCDDFFAMLKEENSTGIVVVQSRRKDNLTVQDYEDCRKYIPRIEEIKGSQAFEERSRVILSVFRQKHIGIRMLGKDDPEIQISDDVLELSILKQNLGSLATLYFLYQGDNGRLFRLEEEEDCGESEP